MLSIARSIEPPDWMYAKDTMLVMRLLNKESAAPRALFVGGCVRNTLLGCPINEIDIATVLLPDQVTEIFEKNNIKVIPTGIDHGTVTVVVESAVFEITTLRRDVATDGRHAVVAYTDDWAEDAARRDFTMNTLLADTDGHIYDPTRVGLADLEAGRVVFVGDAARRIAEDYLRILRFFRFYALYGKGKPDAQALVACQGAADHIFGLSRERITQEFLKILIADKAVDVLDLMFKNNVMKEITGAEYSPDVLRRLMILQEKHELTEIVSRLITINDDAEALERFLVLSNRQKRLLGNIKCALDEADATAAEKLIYRYGRDAGLQTLLIVAARGGAAADFAALKDWPVPILPVKGTDVLAAGISAGPQVGDILKQVEDWWLAHNMQPDRDACFAQIKALLVNDR